jgi:hypothetical protein|tara:strand:+ start:347 stop:496 length:150 start_codon:yes stop_codon:yes gene_type:complete
MKYHIITGKGKKLLTRPKGKEFNSTKDAWDYIDALNYGEELFVVKKEIL